MIHTFYSSRVHYWSMDDGKEGSWTSTRFMQQMERAIRIADFQYVRFVMLTLLSGTILN